MNIDVLKLPYNIALPNCQADIATGDDATKYFSA